MSIWIRIRILGGKDLEEKLHQKNFNSIFQNYIKKSLKNNKQNIVLSITKESLLLNFQFRIMNLYIFLAFLPPGSRSGSGGTFLMRVHANPDPQHCLKLAQIAVSSAFFSSLCPSSQCTATVIPIF